MLQIINLLQCVRNRSLESFLCECAVFVCNKWDLIEREGTEAESRVRNYIIERLDSTWPDLNPQSQVVQLSTTNAAESQNYGISSHQFVAVMNAVRTMMLKTIAARLKAEWRYMTNNKLFYRKCPRARPNWHLGQLVHGEGSQSLGESISKVKEALLNILNIEFTTAL